MTTENPWSAEDSDKNSSSGANQALESLGFTFFEQSSDRSSDSQASAGDAAAPTDFSGYSDIATAAIEQVAGGRSTELVPMSRRALRDAERSQTAVRRTRRPSPEETLAAPLTATALPPAARVATAPTVSAVLTRPAPPRVPLRRRIAKKTFPPVVMLATAALLVGTSVPATALFDPDAPPASTAMALSASSTVDETVEPAEDQVVDVEVTGELAATVATRDEWGVTSYAEMLRLQYGNVNYSYSTTGTGAIRWPFPYATQISSGFGDRVSPCRGCSSYHRGLDFVATYGAPVGSIAEGVVTAVGRETSYGYRVRIEHVINGQRVTTLYAHMVDNSSVLQVGSVVQPGEIVGALGNTGLTTGPHLHFELAIDDIPIDPFAWLKANAS